MICKLSKQDGSGVVEKDEMKSIQSPYTTQYIYLFLLALSINQNPKI